MTHEKDHKEPHSLGDKQDEKVQNLPPKPEAEKKEAPAPAKPEAEKKEAPAKPAPSVSAEKPKAEKKVESKKDETIKSSSSVVKKNKDGAYVLTDTVAADEEVA